MREKVRTAVPILVPTLLIITAESFFFFKQMETTLAIHGLNVLICILLPVFTSYSPYLLQAFSLVSILRILNIGMPVFFTLTLYWFPFIYGVAILAAFLVLWRTPDVIVSMRDRVSRVLGRYYARRRETGKGWRNLYLPIGIVVGLVFAIVEYRVLKAGSLIPSLDVLSLVALAIVMFLFVGFGEELIFRFILQSRLQRIIGTWGGIGLASALFTAMHSGYSSVPYLFFVLIVGLILGYTFHRTGSLGFVTVIHGSINFFLFSFIPFGYLGFS
jgi:membrane protease YdiL (CAAX protease family)